MPAPAPLPSRPDGISSLSHPYLSTALALLFAALVVLPGLGHKPLTDWDEGIYAEVAREMVSLGWLVPHWNFQVWLEKPPLQMWITAAFFKLLGISEFAARAVSALSGVATAALLHGWLIRTRGVLTAWLSTCVLLGTFGFLHACHTGETDALLALGCAIALVGLAQAVDASPNGWYLFWIGFGLAAMTKGSASVVLLLTAFLLLILPPRTLHLERPFFLGFALFLVLVVPWHLAMYLRFGHQFVAEYVGFHVLTRATHQIEGHNTGWWFYLKVLLVSAPPFVLLYPAALSKALQGMERNASLRPWAIFSLVVLALYTVVQTRLPQYIVPAYPALSVLTAVWLADWIRPLLAGRRPKAFWVKLGLAAGAVSTGLILATTPARRALHSVSGSDLGLPDNKDSTSLLRAAFGHAQPIPGPLLVWRQARLSIATALFYSEREVIQVSLQPLPPEVPRDRYRFNSQPLAEAVTVEPRLILLDRDLLPQLPGTVAYTPIQSMGPVELGSIARRP
jgi:4-amino-4-deoxy-L-arabinose transferase-like glycosyltransferase